MLIPKPVERLASGVPARETIPQSVGIGQVHKPWLTGLRSRVSESAENGRHDLCATILPSVSSQSDRPMEQRFEILSDFV